MADKFRGFIYLHKTLLFNKDIWDTGKKYDERSAWIYLLMMANYEDHEIRKDLVIRRGQVFTSQKKLAEEWKWSVSKVHRFLGKLTERHMATFEKLNVGKGATLITILNYCNLQDPENFRKANGKQSEIQTESEVESKRVTPNKYNKDNEKNEERGPDFWL